MTDFMFDKVKIMSDSEEIWLMLRAKFPHAARKIVDEIKDKLYCATIKEHRNKRSLDANAYAWVLMDKIASILHTDKWEVYLEMLSRYGVFTHIIVKPSVVEKVKQEWRTVKEIGEVTVNGQAGIQLQCYFGSSTYDTKEMSRLIDGIASECKEMGIETISPDKLDTMKSEWGT